jgi:ribosomal-protein-alanine N-acetyltransferase
MTAVPKLKLELVPMANADIDAVTAIEQRAHPFPWTRGNFADSLKAGHSAWVFRAGGELVGYGVLMLTVDDAELLTVTIAPEYQRRGLGSNLLDQLFGIARSHGAVRMLLEVRPGNESGLALYRRFGFAEIGRRRAYYHGKEDAIVMARDL